MVRQLTEGKLAVLRGLTSTHKSTRYQHQQHPPHHQGQDYQSYPQGQQQQYGYDQYQQQGQAGYDQRGYGSSAPSEQFPQQGAYDQQPYPADPNDPNAQGGEKGLLGAVGGAWAGHKAGKSAGHGLLGTIGGAFLGSKLEDEIKKKRTPSPGRTHHSSHHGSSSGGRW